MKAYLLITLFCFVNIIHAYSQINKHPRIETGVFVCRANQYLIYMENEQIDSEVTTYAIKTINLNSNERMMLSRQTKNKFVNVSDTAILYVKGSSLEFWNFELKRKSVYYKTNKDMDIIGLSYNKNNSSLLLVQINVKTNELTVKIINNRKQIIFCQKIKVNEMEMEGVNPIIDTSGNFFVFLIQDKLYTIDSNILELKCISNKCDCYALNNSTIVYYKFNSAEKTEGYSIDLITKEVNKIDNSLNNKIYNCDKSFLFTANIDNSFIPTYIICNKTYLWLNSKWQITQDAIVYKDKKLIVRIPFERDKIKDNSFQWESR